MGTRAARHQKGTRWRAGAGHLGSSGGGGASGALPDDGLMGAVVLTQHDAAGVLCGVVLIQTIQQ